MPRKRETNSVVPSRYMTFAEIARELQVSAESVREKALIRNELDVVDVGNGSERAQWRVPRISFDAYCERVERDAAARFGRAS